MLPSTNIALRVYLRIGTTLTHSKKSIGPRIEPWELLHWDILQISSIYCYLQVPMRKVKLLEWCILSFYSLTRCVMPYRKLYRCLKTLLWIFNTSNLVDVLLSDDFENQIPLEFLNLLYMCDLLLFNMTVSVASGGLLTRLTNLVGGIQW